MAATVCLVTTGQPVTNPRAVKEADALAAAGYDVHMIGAFAGQWAVDAEPAFMAGRPWSLDVVDWRRASAPQAYWQSAVRHRAALKSGTLSGLSLGIAERVVARPAMELRRRVLRRRADLYVAHNLGALPAAARAAARHGARLGFDAEDFHSGQFGPGVSPSVRCATAAIEQRYLPRCDYVTASSPGIADAYRPVLAGLEARCVLNVSSRGERTRPSVPRRRSVDPFRLYWFSQTIGPERGLEDVVHAMATLPSIVELHVRGSWAAGYEADLRRLAARCGVAAARLVAYPLAAPDAMVDQAAQFDIGLALEPGGTTNSRLAVSNKLFTYLMAGVPVVASGTPGQAWFLEQAPDVGWSYRPGDARELSVLLRRCLDHPDDLAAAGKAAASAADSRFCWEVEQRAFLDVVSRILQSGAPRTAPSAALPQRIEAGRTR